jgi:hypothetical protein
MYTPLLISLEDYKNIRTKIYEHFEDKLKQETEEEELKLLKSNNIISTKITTYESITDEDLKEEIEII